MYNQKDDSLLYLCRSLCYRGGYAAARSCFTKNNRSEVVKEIGAHEGILVLRFYFKDDGSVMDDGLEVSRYVKRAHYKKKAHPRKIATPRE